MNIYLTPDLYVSSLKTTPILGVVSKVRAKVEIILNQGIAMRGINLAYGQYGYYLSFPTKKIVAPLIYFSSHKSREKLLKEVVTCYQFQKNKSNAL